MPSLAKIVSIVGDWMSIEHGWSVTGKGELKYSEIPAGINATLFYHIAGQGMVLRPHVKGARAA